MPSKPEKVLMFLPQGGANALRILAGVRDVATARRWDLFVAECSHRMDVAFQFIRSPGGGTVTELWDGIRPDGILVMGKAIDPIMLQRPGRRSVPTVFIDRPAASSAKGREPVCVFGDADSYARLAAHELFRTGFCDYAFLPWPGDPPWSRERCECFSGIVVREGKSFHPFRPPRGGAATDLVAHVAPFLESLPKPCGIFAANDSLGEAALRVCATRGWAVPQDIAVIGVDNLDFICETTRPTLSSVCRNLEGDGRAAAELLAEWMESPGRRPRPRATQALCVARRASSFFLPDIRVARAMEFIRVHACEEGFAPPKVVRSMGLCRSQTDLLFRRVLGRSVLDAIHDARIVRAQDLLRAEKSASYVADTCGYGSLVDFRRVFKHRVGTTVRKWTIAARNA